MVTPEMIINFPHIIEPDEDLSGRLVYSCQLLIDKTDTLGIKQLQVEIDRAIEKGKKTLWKGKVPNFRYAPLRDGDEEIANGTKQPGRGYEGRLFLTAKSTIKPGVVGPDLQPIISKDAIYSGCIVRADIAAYPYSQAGNNGVGWGLNNIMLVRQVPDEERLDGRSSAEVVFKDFAIPTE